MRLSLSYRWLCNMRVCVPYACLANDDRSPAYQAPSSHNKACHAWSPPVACLLLCFHSSPPRRCIMTLFTRSTRPRGAVYAAAGQQSYRTAVGRGWQGLLHLRGELRRKFSVVLSIREKLKAAVVVRCRVLLQVHVRCCGAQQLVCVSPVERFRCVGARSMFRGPRLLWLSPVG